MHLKLFTWLSLWSLVALFALPAAAQGPAGTPAAATTQIPGTIRASRVVGQVTFEDIATKVVSPLANDKVISQGTIVRTAAGSSVVLLFSNGASISLAFGSELNIEQFTQDPFAGDYEPSKATDEPSVSTTNIKLTQGELVGNVKKLRRGGAVESKFTVGTPVGAAGIRGTTFKIVYRPSGDGRTFNFTLTTVEGNVEVQIATGTVNAPPVSVTDNKEVVLTNVEVNPVTNQITATTSTGQTATVTTAPPVVDAPVTTIQQVQAAAQQIVQAIANVVFTSPAPPPPPPPPTPTNTTPTTTEEKKETPPPPTSPGTTTTPPRVTI